MSDELKSVWKEAILAYFRVVFRNVYEEDHETTSR
jgi:hypothetical protein